MLPALNVTTWCTHSPAGTFAMPVTCVCVVLLDEMHTEVPEPVSHRWYEAWLPYPVRFVKSPFAESVPSFL